MGTSASFPIRSRVLGKQGCDQPSRIVEVESER